jgi:hypothetical protein
LFVSEAAVSGKDSPKSMSLLGQIQGIDISILVDSGSSNTFINAQLAARMTGASRLAKHLSVMVANVVSMYCEFQFQHTPWEVQGLQFYSDFKVLHLQQFDVILGYDWLEQFSPMKIHWTAKWVSIPYESRTVVIQGVLSELGGDVVQLLQLIEEDLNLDVDDVVPVGSQQLLEIQQLLLTYANVFAAKVSYPPPQSCTHTILLIPGAKHVSIHPYRYAPALKMRQSSRFRKCCRLA